MLNSISGRLTFVSMDCAGIDTSGVEWQLDCSATTVSRLPPVGSELRLFTYMHHNQDVMRLFGFFTVRERELFLHLVTVNGVGPSLARKILSGAEPEQFIEALDAGDLSVLEAIPGLGVKTAQKILLQLRGKLSMTEGGAGAAPTELNEVVTSLKAMGFDVKRAEKTVALLLKEAEIRELSGEERDKEILRRSIIDLSR